MKKQSVIALLSILCLLVGLPVRAQLQDPRHNLAIGINGGVNLSSVSFEPSIKQKTFITPSVGVTVRYISERYFKILCGIQEKSTTPKEDGKKISTTAQEIHTSAP